MENNEPAYFNQGISTDKTKSNYFSLFPEELIASVLDSFIINKPVSGKVGGDGFWVYQENDDLYVAVFDCMGHGHLASMMTRVYIQSLQKVVETRGIKDPGMILMNLHEEIGTKFKGKSNLQVGTGADIGLLKVNFSVRKLEFAGAKMDLLHVTNRQLQVLKADRIQVGELFDYDHTYRTYTIEFCEQHRSNFYLLTDGFRDLIGGPSERRLGKRESYDVFRRYYGLPLLIQKENLISFMEDWAGLHNQLDDILIIGFSL